MKTLTTVAKILDTDTTKRPSILAHRGGLVGQIRYKPRILRDHLADATINGVAFLEPFLALSSAFPVPLHTREVAGSKPAAPIAKS